MWSVACDSSSATAGLSKSAAGLAGYPEALERSFVLQDLRTLRTFPGFMEHATRLFVDYPAMARDLFRQLFAVDGTPVRPLRKTLPPIARRAGYLNLARDLWKGAKAL